jgi:hypothetical protein
MGKRYDRGQLGPVVVPGTPPLLAARVDQPVAREPKSLTPISERRQPSWIEIECTAHWIEKRSLPSSRFCQRNERDPSRRTDLVARERDGSSTRP